MKKNKILIKIINLLVDGGFLLAVMIFFNFNYYFSLIFILTSLIILFFQRTYTTKIQLVIKEMVKIVIGLMISLPMAIVLNYLIFKQNLLNKDIWQIFIASLLVIIVSHLVFRIIQWFLIRFAKWQIRILIFGFSRSAERLIEEFSNQNLIQVVGILDNVISKGTEIGGIKVLGKLDNIEKFILEKKIDQVFQASNTEQTINLLNICLKNKVELKILPNLLGVYRHQIEAEEIMGISLLRISPTPIMGWGSITKRVFDIILTTMLISLLSPLFIINLMRLKILKPNKPTIVRQSRFNGYLNREFLMFHFRDALMLPLKTISKNYQKNTLLLGRIKSATKKSSFWMILAEMPGLFNVFLGNLSLIGPRPPYPLEAQYYHSFYCQRFVIKPGLISPATITGRNKNFQEMFDDDCRYIEKWSLWLDVKILFLSFVYIFKKTIL